MNSTNILDEIARKKFVATEAQVESLAALVVSGTSASSTYLSILLAHVQTDMGERQRKPAADIALALIDATHTKLYASVLRGVGPEDLARDERDRRATFARSAASDLRHYVIKGGDVRKLDPATVRKHMLRKVGRKVPTGTRTQRVLTRSVEAIERAVMSMAKKDPRNATKRVKSAITTLERLLAQIDNMEAPAPRKARKTPARVVRANLTRTPVAERPPVH